VALRPPLLAELAARRLASLDVAVVVLTGDGAAPGHYDAVIRNVALPPGVIAELVVDLPAPVGTAASAGSGSGQLVALGIEEVAELVARRWGVAPRGA
jgi:hypothetical protein